jgi:hypothetical protein
VPFGLGGTAGRASGNNPRCGNGAELEPYGAEHTLDGPQARIPAAALELADVRLIDTCSLGHLALRKAQRTPAFGNICEQPIVLPVSFELSHGLGPFALRLFLYFMNKVVEGLSSHASSLCQEMRCVGYSQ